MKTYSLQHIDLLSLAKFGFLIGAIVSFLPITFWVLLVWWLTNLLANWLQSLVDFTIPISLGFFGDLGIDVNVIEMLHLASFLSRVNAWASLGWFKALLSIVGLTLFAGVVFAMFTLLAGVIFNLAARVSGGVKFTLAEELLQGAAAAPLFGVETSAGEVTNYGPRLEVLAPFQQIFAITRQNTIIGSGADCAIRLEGLALHHAQLAYEEGRYILYAQSEGKVQVQGHAVLSRNLVRDGFEIEMGPYRMIFRQ